MLSPAYSGSRYGVPQDIPMGVMEPERLLPAVIVVPSIASIVAEVAAARRLRPADLYEDTAARPIAHARHEVMWRAYQVRRPDGSRRYSTTQIGRHFDGKGGRTRPFDHTTVIAGIRGHARRRRAALIGRIRDENALSALIHRRT